MTRLAKRGMWVGLALLLAGCAENGRPVSTPEMSLAPSDSLPVAIGSLPPQELSAGSCGLFLWRKGSATELLFVADSRLPVARMNLDGAPVTLARTSAEGDLSPGALLRQRYESEGRTIDIGFIAEPQPGLIGGAAVKSGSLRISGADGWDIVLPVAGLIACKPR
ncbi:MAG: hypothetical protein Tsb008_00760 [Rhodothalassiaceae bacterium]